MAKKKKKTSKWIDTSAFNDGYDLGDGIKTVVNTVKKSSKQASKQAKKAALNKKKSIKEDTLDFLSSGDSKKVARNIVTGTASIGVLGELFDSKLGQGVKTAEDNIDSALKTSNEDEKRTYFRRGLFEDGYDFGDVTKTLLGTNKDIADDLGAGVGRIGEGLIDTVAYGVGAAAKGLGNDKLADKTKKFISRNLVDENNIGEKIAQVFPSNQLLGYADRLVNKGKTEEVSVLGDKSDSLVQSAGQLGGTIGLQAVGVPWWVTTGVTGFGAGTEEAFKNDATYGEAGVYGGISAGSEVIFEKLSGGIKFGGKTLDEGLKRVLSDAIANKTASSLAKFGLDAVGEGTEEVLTEITQNIGKKLTYEDEKTWSELLTSEEAMDGYIESFIGGAVLGGGMSGANRIRASKTGRDYDTGLTDNEQSVVTAEVESRAAEQQKKSAVESEVNRIIEEQQKTVGELTESEKKNIRETVQSKLDSGELDYTTAKLSARERTKIEKQVREDLEGGYISIDSIESTLSKDKTARIKELEQQLTVADPAKKSEIEAEINQLKLSRATQMKGMLSKDNYLQESYKQEALKSQEFSREITDKDSDITKELIESAKNSKMNNTRKMHDLFEYTNKIANDSKTKYGFVNNEQLKELGYEADGVNINGLVRVDKDGATKVLINTDSDKAINTIIGHETTHLLEDANEYKALQNIVKEYATTKGDYDGRIKQITELYKGTNANIENEVTADLVGDYLFTDEQFINNLSAKEPNVFQKIYDYIKHAYKMATAGSKEARQLEQVKRSFDKAYKQISKTTTQEVKDNSLTEADSNTRYHISEVFSNEIDKTLKGEMQENSQVKARDYTPKVLVDNGVNDLPMLITQKHIKSIIYTEAEAKEKGLPTGGKNNYHGLGKDTLIKAVDNMDNPSEVYKQDDKHYLVITEIKNKAGDSIIIPVRIDGKGTYNDVYIDENQISSVYGKKNLSEYLKRNNFEKVYTKKGIALNPGVQFPDISNSFGNNISENKNNVNRSLTKEQEEYFKDSKVRDENGNLKVMYHGTSAGGHTVFDPYGKAKYGLFGVGTYFTDNKEVAESYTEKGRGKNKQIYETYLNITNPIDMDAAADPTAWSKALPDANFPAEGTNEDFYRAMEEYFEDQEYSRWEASEAALETLESMGYDGITHIGGGRFNKKDETRHRVYIAFQPEQIKNINNEKPTVDADIRYSFSAKDSEYKSAVERGDIETVQRLVDEAAEQSMKNSAIRDNNGLLLKVYHGTNAKFNSFNDPKHTPHGEAGTFFFSPWRSKSEEYGDNVRAFYLNIERPRLYDEDFNELNPDEEEIDGAIFIPEDIEAGINPKLQGDTEIVAYYPDQIKSADPITYDDNGNVIPLSKRFNEKDSDIRYSISEDSNGKALTENQQYRYRNVSPLLKDENGRLKRYYHGTSRGDRVGTIFDPERATSGPMAYFTDNQEIATNYSRDKADTSLAYDSVYDSYETQFRVDIDGENISVVELWHRLSAEEKARIKEAGSHITMDDDWENVVYNSDVDTGLGNFDSYLLRENRGNALSALVDSWLNDGNIYGDEHKFLEVLKLAGIEDVQYMDPNYREEKVYEVYLNVTNPFDTSTVDENFLADITDYIENADMSKYADETANADMWDKRSRGTEAWLERLAYDIEENTSHVWTSIPDVVTDFLKERGYDGIVDTGGKGGGIGHQVVIPFYSEQVKNIDNENPTDNPDIRYSLSGKDNDIAPIRDDYKALNESDIPYVEQQGTEAFNRITDDMAPVVTDDPVYEEDDFEPANPLEADGRDIKDVGKRNVKAYMYENPEVKPFFQAEAAYMLNDLRNSVKGQKHFNDQLYYDSGGEQGWYGTKRETSEEIAYLLDKFNYSYADIEKGLNAIIEDHGAENNAISKRIEFMIDERLREGYEDMMYGDTVPPNEEYINLLREKQITEYSDEAYEAWVRSLADVEAPVEPITQGGIDYIRKLSREAGIDMSDVTGRYGVGTLEEMSRQQYMDAVKWLDQVAIAPVRVPEAPEEPTPVRETVEDIAPIREDIPISQGVQQEMREDGTTGDVPEDIPKKTRKDLQRELLVGESNFIIKALEKAKNIPMALMNNTDTIRNTEMVFGREAGKKINEAIFQKAIDNEARSIYWQNKQRADLKALGIKARSKESAAVQKYGEGEYINEFGDLVEYGDGALMMEFPDEATQEKIKEAARVIKAKYERYIDQANEVLTGLGFDPIPKRKDYMRHFQELNDVFSRNGIPFNPQNMKEHVLPTDINGLTEFWSPQKNYFANMQPRKGKRTTLDAITGIDGYISGIANLIFHTEDIQRGRAFEGMIRENFGEERGWDIVETLPKEEQLPRAELIQNNHLSNYAAWVHEWTNNIAGKKNKIDRSVEAMFGRKGFSFLDGVRKQVGANMIGFNIASSITNLIAPIQAISKTNKIAVMKGTVDTFRNIVSKDDFVDKNSFLTSRFGTDMLSKTRWEKMQDAGYVFMKGVDYFSSNLIVRSKYNELVKKGMSEKEAHKEAGKFAARIMGDRTKGANAQLYNSKMVGVLTQFQLEVNNQLYSMFYDTYHDSKENAKGNAAKMAAGMTFTLGQLFAFTHLFGKGFEAVAGYNPTFDVLGIIATLFGIGEDEEEEKTLGERTEAAMQQLVKSLPYTSVFTGGRIPIGQALPIKQLYTGEDQYGNEKSRLSTLAETIPYYVMPGGYGQLKKTAGGVDMFVGDKPVSGSYTESGNLRFPVEETPANVVHAAIFGKWANKNAQDYIANERMPLKEKQIQEYKDLEMPIKDYWEYREGLSEQDSLEDKFDYIAGLDIPVSKKNIMINNIVDREDRVDLTGYSDFGSYEEFEFATENPEEYAISKLIGFDDYLMYDDYIYNIRADKDQYGNSIRGSRKAKVMAYINSLDIDYGAKLIMHKQAYSSDDELNVAIIEYVNSRQDLTYEDRVAILTEVGMQIGSDGRIYW